MCPLSDHEADEVIAGDSLSGDPAQPYQLASARDDFKGQHVILRDAVLDAAHPTGIGRDIAANGAPRGAGRIRRIPQAMLGSGRAQLVVDHAGLNHCQPLQRIDQADLVKPIKCDDHAAVNGIGAAR